MAKAFFSFHFDNDVFRAGQVRNMGVVQGDEPIGDQSWEKVKKSGDEAVKTWIKNQMKSCDVVIVLVGSQTASRPLVDYEIRYAWDNYWPIFGIRIHGLKDIDGTTSAAGPDPFANVRLTTGGKLSDYVPLHLPSGADSRAVYADIQAKIGGWVMNAPKRKRP